MEATFAVVIESDCGLVVILDDAIWRPPALNTMAVSFVPDVTESLMVKVRVETRGHIADTGLDTATTQVVTHMATTK
jgi:hypothetical protein